MIIISSYYMGFNNNKLNYIWNRKILNAKKIQEVTSTEVKSKLLKSQMTTHGVGKILPFLDKEKDFELERKGDRESCTNLYANILFKTEDICKDDHVLNSSYDVILCLRVTKWIHLNEGDQGIYCCHTYITAIIYIYGSNIYIYIISVGIINLFQKLYKLLSEGGVLILQPQQWYVYINY